MGTPSIYPLSEYDQLLLKHAKLQPHAGTVTVMRHADPSDLTHPVVRAFMRFLTAQGQSTKKALNGPFAATFLVPATGNGLFFLNGAGSRLSRDFGEGLKITGECINGSFEVSCPRYYVKATSE